MFSAIADNDIDSNQVGVWTQSRERYGVMKGIVTDVSDTATNIKNTVSNGVKTAAA